MGVWNYGTDRLTARIAVGFATLWLNDDREKVGTGQHLAEMGRDGQRWTDIASWRLAMKCSSTSCEELCCAEVLRSLRLLHGMTDVVRTGGNVKTAGAEWDTVTVTFFSSLLPFCSLAFYFIFAPGTSSSPFVPRNWSTNAALIVGLFLGSLMVIWTETCGD